MLNRLTSQIDFQSQALLLRSERQRLLAGNIANADTPGYMARDMDFAAALRQATGNTAAGSSGLNVPLPKLPGLVSANGFGGATETTLRYAAPSQSNLDGNSVDMDRERASFADNALKYEAALRFINGQVRSMLDAMKSPQQG